MTDQAADSTKKPLTYQSAGVDIDAGNELVKRIGAAVHRTARPELLAGVGGFGALFEVPAGYRHPVLVSGTDGVGTKLKLAVELGLYDGIGVDLVAMCVNDILTLGAEPLFFLDYFATGKLDLEVAVAVVESIATGCELAGATLAGGETAEMPGMYRAAEFDLAGFCVGVVEKDAVIDGKTIIPGDRIIGLGSSGFHANGYSLIRKILKDKDTPLSTSIGDASLGELLLAPTRIYVPSVRSALNDLAVKGMVHVTGGGLLENVPRILPAGLGADIYLDSWRRPVVYDWLDQTVTIELSEGYRTFNQGVGFVLITDAENEDRALDILSRHGEQAWPIGEVLARSDGAVKLI